MHGQNRARNSSARKLDIRQKDAGLGGANLLFRLGFGIHVSNLSENRQRMLFLDVHLSKALDDLLRLPLSLQLSLGCYHAGCFGAGNSDRQTAPNVWFLPS